MVDYSQPINVDSLADPMDRQPIPAGKYPIAVRDMEWKAPKADPTKPSYLEVIFAVVDGPHKGRQIWNVFNLRNENPTAREIAEGELKSLAKACKANTLSAGFPELKGRPVLAQVRIDTSGQNPRNQVQLDSTTAPYTGAMPTAAAPGPAPTNGPATAGFEQQPAFMREQSAPAPQSENPAPQNGADPWT